MRKKKYYECKRANCSKYEFEEEIKVGIWTARVCKEMLGWIMPDGSFEHDPANVRRLLKGWRTKG